jgi:hypothetical protein
MNLILGVVGLVFCLFFSSRLSEKYSLRHCFYNDFSTFNDRLKNEIAYTQNSIIKTIEQFDSKSDFFCGVNDYFKLSNKFQKSYLSNEEIDEFNSYLSTIGKGDKQSQLLYLDGVKDSVNKKREQTEMEEKKFKPLYKKVGFMIGLIVLIIFL